jgi:hypothetical protein
MCRATGSPALGEWIAFNLSGSGLLMEARALLGPTRY